MTPDPRTLTAGQTIERLHGALRDYIEAAYHVGDAGLVEQRRRLLNKAGVIFQEPFLESTPRYTSDANNGRFADLNLPSPALEALLAVSTASKEGGRLLYDPPFSHQAKALRYTLNDGQSLVVTTGTGSGKTESFLMPVLGSLARQASAGAPFEKPAVRAILLYPMNALVNDQLGRLRMLFGDPRLVRLFQSWAGRPARFARYTGRTLYPGVRTPEKDSARLKPIKTFYVDTLAAALDPRHDGHEQALTLYRELKARGKWPAKPDLIEWWGDGRWKDRDGNYRRGITLSDDAELLTRHEVLAAPPDVLVTNYSMLEYMMMRPVERPIFDTTALWLADNPDEKLILVIDEAHLYRGASGAEVALLLRRLQQRLGVGPDRLQVIATSASFEAEDKARTFASDLTGLVPESFEVVRGDLSFRPHADAGTSADAALLAGLDLNAFYGADAGSRLTSLASFFEARSVSPEGDELVERTLYRALESYGPLGRLVNASMKQAQPLAKLGAYLFPDAPHDLAEQAATVLMALGSAAKPEPGAAGLLPCRIHAFFRGLPGLWACLDPQCSALDASERGGPTGALYAQPRESCSCHARVFELYTCRSCGTAFARAYTDSVVRPKNLWSEPGAAFTLDGQRVEALEPIDLLLEAPPPPSGDGAPTVEPHELDLDTGLLGGRGALRKRTVYLPPSSSRDRTPEQVAASPHASAGQFVPCPICNESGIKGRSTVMDHQTKGDQPFQALITAQIEVQPPSPNSTADPAFAPLKGRKVLIFSDSRQLAARLSPTVQSLSTRDALRPLIVAGYTLLYQHKSVRKRVTLNDLYTATLIASADLGVRLRPERAMGESFHGPNVAAKVASGILDDPEELRDYLADLRSEKPPQSLAKDLLDALSHRYYGLSSLGLGSVCEAPKHADVVDGLPQIDGVAETPEQKRALARLWFQQWLPGGHLKLSCLDAGAIGREVRTHKGTFKSLDRWLGSSSATFKKDWLPTLLKTFAEATPGSGYWLLGSELALDLDGPWAYCERCRTTQRPFPGSLRCVQCAKETVRVIEDPNADTVFSARKGYYRSSTAEALADPPRSPMSLIAAEHTAQLNAAQEGEVFSDAEIHELLFQDVDLGPDPETRHSRYAVDVLSCTTTMEVGIDIGALSGVALRSLPPARSNYQQRAGRAGRRGDAVATVMAFGSADSHDEHYFSNPAEMISGPVTDPELTLSNRDIARRHLTAYLLQRFFHDEFPDVTAEERPDLFSALGTVEQFKKTEGLCRPAFETWLRENEADLHQSVDGWLPHAISDVDRTGLLEGIVAETLATLDRALRNEPSESIGSKTADPTLPPLGVPEETSKLEETPAPEEPPSDEHEDETAPPIDREESAADAGGKDTLLDRLLYEGILPRYAFPTDVASFRVFDKGRSTPFRPAFRYQPQQGLAAALSQYAPGKQLYIGNRRWTSGALYSQKHSDLFDAWTKKRVYFECEACGFAETHDASQGERGMVLTCPACKREDAFGKGRYWVIPPGFAHPVDLDVDTTPDAPFSQSYATRAKLAATARQNEDAMVSIVNDRVTSWAVRSHLLVTNRGPREEGYHLCTRCGRIERSAQGTSSLSGPHNKPYPDREPVCPGDRMTAGIVLGTEFISDILLLCFRLDRTRGIVLRPGELGTDVALRTVSEALAQAACEVLQIEPGELAAEYRTALSPGGANGDEVEVYLYDTLPGGAGFSHLAGRRMDEILSVALKRLEGCQEGCDASCYRCLRSFGNRFEHDRLDRHVGADLLRFLLTDVPPTLSAERQSRAAHRLHSALAREWGDEVAVERDVFVTPPGLTPVHAPLLIRSSDGTNSIVAIASPVAPDVPPTQELAIAREALHPVLLIDEMLVRKNLPRAVNRVRSSLGL